MRILRMHIDRFGRLTDRNLEFQQGFTVVHGANESGKTTMMEFIRSTLVPTAQRNVYPKRARTDSGTVTVDEDGVEMVMVLEGRARKGEVPECIEGMDPMVYRSIFAMDQAGLDSDDAISSGDIRSRFLMLPGGELMPALIAEAVKESESILGKSLRSNTDLSSIESELEKVSVRIAELRAQVDRYGSLASERERLLRRLKSLEGGAVSIDDSRVIVALYESNRGNYAELTEVEDRLRAMGGFRMVTQQEVEEYRDLVTRSRMSTGDFTECFRSCEAILEDLGGIDPDDVTAIIDELEQLPFLMPREVAGPPRRVQPPVKKRMDTRRMTTIAGVAIAAAGAACSFVTPYALALVPVGLAVVFLGRRSKDREVEVHNGSPFEERVRGHMDRFGMASKGLESDVRRLTGLARDVRRYNECSERCLALRRSSAEASERLTIFLDSYGGKEGFEHSLEVMEEVRGLQSRIDSLRKVLEASGLDPDVRTCPVTVEEDETVSDASAIGVEIGRIESEMESIMQSDELEGLMDRRVALTARRDRLLEQGAEAMVMRRMAELACDSAYSANGAGVVATADRYLSMMTGGRYRMENDPREAGITVRDDEGTKALSACSTGLRAQVLLSLKLAVAREMGGGKVPMILDDVLLPFDTERKQGAMKALERISREMQVIMFTCDDAIADTCPRSSLVRLGDL